MKAAGAVNSRTSKRNATSKLESHPSASKDCTITQKEAVMSVTEYSEDEDPANAGLSPTQTELDEDSNQIVSQSRKQTKKRTMT